MLRPTLLESVHALPTNLLHGPTFPALLQLPLVYSLQLDRINIQLTDPVGDATIWFLITLQIAQVYYIVHAIKALVLYHSSYCTEDDISTDVETFQ